MTRRSPLAQERGPHRVPRPGATPKLASAIASPSEVLALARSRSTPASALANLCWLLPRMPGGARSAGFLEAVSDLLDHRRPAVRREAAASLGLFLLPQARVRLELAADHWDQEIRVRAALGLGIARGHAAASKLRQLLSNRSEASRVRAAAADALSGHGTGATRAALMDALGDRSLLVRLSAIHSLGELRERKAVPALRRMARSAGARIRSAARSALQRGARLRATTEVL